MAVTSDPQAVRASGRWLALAGRVRAEHDGGPAVRFGFTASRRHARRAVDRNLVKRVLREAARQRIEDLDAAAAERAVDIVLRLRTAVPAAETLGRDAWRAALRSEAEALLAGLASRLHHSRDGR